jgi:ketosteroid isomerase-like protein
MSRENVEVVREAFDAFQLGDMRRFGDVMDPHVVTYAPEGWPEGGPFVGREDSLREFERLQEDWTDHRIVMEEILEGGDWVVVRFRWEVTGRASGVETVMHQSAAYRLQDGKIAEMRFFWEHGQALGAAGLDGLRR